MLEFILSFLISFALVFAIMPNVIRIAIEKKLVALPEERSSHDIITPCLGGIPIFLGILFCGLLLTPIEQWSGLQYILSALVIVFMIGTKDDISQLSAGKKTAGLVIAIAILVTRGEVRLESLYDLFYVSRDLPYWLSIAFSVFTLLVITNAFNLIDGIDGLAGTVGIIAMLSFGTWFFVVGMAHLGILALAAAGGLLAFLYYNMSKSKKTFMGDTGALVIGMLLGVMTVEFIDICSTGGIPAEYRFANPISVAVGILIIPLFDTIRVFITRAIRGVSPMKPDRRHIHHLLIDSNLSHAQATFVLAMVNLVFISLALYLDPLLDLHLILAIEITLAVGLTYMLNKHASRVKRNKHAARVRQTA
ncbi:UDP-N-acetylmuramyl pentapeptide phosphotransferase/UDP-N-acetylglucosamine-1-phosphate transferase [Lewinella aquimaris]|uniref:UDP-N-acetylmuramyl pentapeptide phosphotransferase/UDP-N-acetylglucosamine-1-phosphate transferase n=1 Tax=Neolewinella aquimaris TaxID=1835722 RepID=A0A840E8R1_9BACT|nr:MraY family glycosyltransferase [Neolewinella aquimaris]MBB4079965.1 UDP-N-acetylmuramyl pentapeptide phosphotransferase/UDP-N-acetylglucosamine-1-phosphate transferase [Neolewinella aquimaris]